MMRRAATAAMCVARVSHSASSPRQPSTGTIYWHLDTYENRAAAVTGRGARGKMVGRAGNTSIIPADTPVTILATGRETRRSVWLVLHPSARPWTAPVDWAPRGLCKRDTP